MARELDQAKLPVYTGRFAWSTDELCTFIKAVKPDYDRFDPKTWPIITTKHLQKQMGRDYVGHPLLPPFIAYESELVRRCAVGRYDKLIEAKRTNGTMTKRILFFHHFPFFYNRFGRWIGTGSMDSNDLAAWIDGLTAKTSDIPTTKSRPSFEGDAFEEILGMIRETEPETSFTKLHSLEQALAEAQQELSKQIIRANTAEKAVDDNRDSHARELGAEKRRTEAVAQSNKTINETLTSVRAQHVHTMASLRQLKKVESGQRGRANRAEDKVKIMETTLQEKNEALAKLELESEKARSELAAVKTEAATAKEQINKIRDEMKRAKELKRKLGCDAIDEGEKRVKLGKREINGTC